MLRLPLRVGTLRAQHSECVPSHSFTQDAAYTLALAFENKASAFFATPSHSTIMSELTLYLEDCSRTINKFIFQNAPYLRICIFCLLRTSAARSVTWSQRLMLCIIGRHVPPLSQKQTDKVLVYFWVPHKKSYAHASPNKANSPVATFARCSLYARARI